MPPSQTPERRLSERVPYPPKIYVAKYDGREYPDPSLYYEVEGRDISTTGVGFYSTQPATPSSMMVIRAGPALIVSRVIHCEEEGRDDEQRYFVGCEFIRRIKSPI